MRHIRRGSKTPVGAGLIVLSSFFYASYGIWTKLMGDFFGGYTASALRSVVVVLLLIPIVFLYRAFEPIEWRKNWGYIVGLTVASLFIWGPLYYAILHAGIGITLTVNYASIVIGVLLLSRFFANEKLTKDKWVSVALGIIGLCLVFSPTTSSLGMLSLIAAVVSGICTAINMIITKKLQYNTIQITTILWITSIIANTIMALVLQEVSPRLGLHIEWLYLIFFAAASIVATLALIKGLKLIEAGIAGILGLLEIVFAILFGMIFFHENPSFVALIGAGVIILASAIPYLKDYNVKHKS